MEETSNLKNEDFYIEPPFSYRPSVAEYLSTFKVTKKGIIADILHLAKKGKLEVEQYFADGFELKLKNNTDLNYNEVFLWQFFEKNKQGENAKVQFSDLDKIVKKYETLVIESTANKFGSAFGFKPKSSIGFIAFGFIASLALSIISSMVSAPFQILIPFLLFAIKDTIAVAIAMLLLLLVMLAVPFLIIYFISLSKINRSTVEKKFLAKEIIWQIIKLQLLFFAFGILVILPIAAIFFFMQNIVFIQTQLLALLLTLVVIAYLAIQVLYYCYFGKIAYKFFYWLFETKESAEHRQKWLAFKEFIINYSELEEKPVKYFELWGEFYYYALAVGAIKKPF